MWFHNIPGYDSIILIFDLGVFINYFYSLAACHIAWLNNPQLFLIPLFGLITSEPSLVCGKNIRNGTVVEVFGLSSPEIDVIPVHPVFAAQLLALRKVINLLLWHQLA